MRYAFAMLVMMSCLVPAQAKNIDLSTLPPRDSVKLTIYNAEDLTLVHETRTLTFRKGVNSLQFSWANTLIDPTSVELEFPKQAASLRVLDTTFPHDKPEMLYWNVESDVDGEATVQISYFTSGLTWSADYVLTADPKETMLQIKGYVRIFNNSGEEYENAQVRLVVGKINLVEKIAALAERRYGIKAKEELAELEASRRGKALKRDALLYFSEAEDGGLGGGVTPAAPKGVIKEGLSEYFIYTIEGTETIPNGWSKRLRSFQGKDVPFDVQYRFRPSEYGQQLVRMYLLVNNEESNLGETPLPDGILRVYRENGQDGLSFVGERRIDYVPIGEDIEINLGPDPQVIHEQKRLKLWRDEFWFQRKGFNIYKKLEDGRHQVEMKDEVAGWQEHVIYVERIRNYRDKPIDVEIRRSFGGHVIFKSNLDPSLHDVNTVEMTGTVAAGEKANWEYHIISKMGYLQKQNNVTLEEGD